MKKIRVELSKKPQGDIAIKKVSIRERILRMLLGSKVEILIIAPSNKVGEITLGDPNKEELERLTKICSKTLALAAHLDCEPMRAAVRKCKSPEEVSELRKAYLDLIEMSKKAELSKGGEFTR